MKLFIILNRNFNFCSVKFWQLLNFNFSQMMKIFCTFSATLYHQIQIPNVRHAHIWPSIGYLRISDLWVLWHQIAISVFVNIIACHTYSIWPQTVDYYSKVLELVTYYFRVMKKMEKLCFPSSIVQENVLIFIGSKGQDFVISYQFWEFSI